MANIKILFPGRRQEDIWTLTKAAATVFLKGQLGSFESSAVVHMDTATEDATFVGAVAQGADATVTEVTLYKRFQIEVDAVSAAYTPGQTVKFSAGGTTTAYKVEDADANAIGRVAQAYPSGTTRIRVNVDLEALAKFPNSYEA